jgi:hypothetical protein
VQEHECGLVGQAQVAAESQPDLSSLRATCG